MPKVGGRRKKARTQKEGDQADIQNITSAFVFKRGKCSQTCKDLSLDFRKCFYPHTAMKLQDSNKLAIKSYLKAAKYYHVSHLVAFQQSKQKTYVRFIKIGGGEMLFRVINYCRMKDVFKRGGQSFNFSLNQPLIVLNNFTQNNQVRQIGRSIQQMFPNINLDKINIKTVKRVLSFTYQTNKKCIYFRHYRIIVNEGGINSSFKQLTKQIHVDMSQFKSFAQYLKQNKSQNGDQKETNENQREVKLVEIGPRMKLKFLSFKEDFGIVSDDEQQEQQEGQNRNMQDVSSIKLQKFIKKSNKKQQQTIQTQHNQQLDEQNMQNQ